MTQQALKYRGDIDGIRAIAVLLVVLFHAGFNRLGGGYIGVDVFFVISGYLITRIVSGQLEDGSFSFRAFYSRRFWRLFPAMITTVALSLLAGYFLLSPQDMEKFGGSAVAAAVSLSNIYFWSGTGYFDTSALTKPLLHTWSLGVEEQFYLLWPALLTLIWRFAGGRVCLVMGVIAGITLGVCEYLLADWRDLTFFWMPFRIYEFAIGAMLASMAPLASSRPVKPLLADALCVAGLSMILVPAFLYRESTPFPGIAALLPCLGTALLIWLAPFSVFGQMLALRPMTWIGKCSYSIYLVHWPLIVFYQMYNLGNPPDVPTSLALVAGSILLGWLLCISVEQPFRHGLPVSARRYPDALGLATIVTLGTLCASAHAWQTHGWTWRLPDELRRNFEQVTQQRTTYWEDAWKRDDSFTRKDNRVYVVGNSFAVDVYYGLREHPELEVISDGTTSSECYSFSAPVNPKSNMDCMGKLEKLLATGNARNADVIVLHENWRVNIPFSQHLEQLKQVIPMARKANPKARLVIFGPRESYTDMVYQKILEYGRLLGADEYMTRFYKYPFEDVRKFDQQLREFASSQNIGYISVLDLTCNANQVCRVLTPDNQMMFWDAGHWTHEGAIFLHQQLEAHDLYNQVLLKH